MSIADTGRFWKILVIPVLQILENTGYTSIADIGRLLVFQYLPEFSSICNTRKYWSLPKYEYYRYQKILGKLVIPVLQILEDSGKYW
jgi:hypothetical protein